VPRSKITYQQIKDNTITEDNINLGIVPPQVGAQSIPTDTTNFDKNLSAADDTVQKALETLDEMIGSVPSNFSYEYIESIEEKTIPYKQQMAVHGTLKLEGKLNILGTLVLRKG